MTRVGKYFEEKIVYFEELGLQDTEQTLRLVIARAKARAIKRDARTRKEKESINQKVPRLSAR